MKYIKYFIQFFIIIILFLVFKIIGFEKASNFGSLIGKVFGKIIKSDKVILKNLEIIKNNSKIKIENNANIVENVFSNYGRILSEYVFLKQFRNGSLKKHVNIIGSENLKKIKSENKKVVFVSGHFNNFELMAMFIEAAGINLAAIYRPLNNIFLNPIMEKMRVKFICKNQIKKGIGGTRELINYLKKDFSVALMIDQRVSEGILSNLFGKPAYTTTIPAQIVKKFNCEIVPVYIERIDNLKFNLIFQEPIKFDQKNGINEITDNLNILLEKMILRDPSQWILTHNRWK